MQKSQRKILLTGDTPTGKLHLGHWVGSLENRVQLQKEYECYFLIANLHAFTTRAERSAEIRESVLDIVLDYLSAGIDPEQFGSRIVLQSEVPAISELTFLFSMLVNYNRVLRNPTLKDEIRDKDLGDNYPFGFLLYPVGQVADILAFRPDIVPVGEDQLPHLEMTKEIAQRFNYLYCKPENKPDLFSLFETKLGRVKRLVGLGAPNAQGQLLKMSKSLNNAILLSDSPDEIRSKIMGMYTDPKRIKASDPGQIENNPLWIFHDAFNTDLTWVANAKELYRAGKIGDVECKRKLIEAIVALTDPMRARRAKYQNQDDLLEVLKLGTQLANERVEITLEATKKLMHQHFFI
ncbi:MAG: tryptophan--tRNA ligase [Gammaproteobacteria bacterium]